MLLPLTSFGLFADLEMDVAEAALASVLAAAERLPARAALLGAGEGHMPVGASLVLLEPSSLHFTLVSAWTWWTTFVHNWWTKTVHIK